MDTQSLLALHHGICRCQKVPERSSYRLQINIFWSFTNICFKKRRKKSKGLLSRTNPNPEAGIKKYQTRNSHTILKSRYFRCNFPVKQVGTAQQEASHRRILGITFPPPQGGNRAPEGKGLEVPTSIPIPQASAPLQGRRHPFPGRLMPCWGWPSSPLHQGF